MNLLWEKKFIKPIVCTLVFSLVFTFFIPLLENKVHAEEISKNDKHSYELNEQEFYQEQLKENPNFKKNIFEVKQGLLNYSIPNGSGQMEEQGVVGSTLKAIKALSPILRHGGTALSWILKPFSKSAATVVKKYARQAANAIDKLDKGTRNALENALVKAGVPRSDAKTIVYIIFLII